MKKHTAPIGVALLAECALQVAAAGTAADLAATRLKWWNATTGSRNDDGGDSMQRRELLRGLIAGAPAAAAVVAGAASTSTDYVREKSDQSLETVKRQLDDLRKRLDRSEASTSKALKVAFALTALSLGVDLSAIL